MINRPNYEHLVEIRIFKDNLLKNWRIWQQLKPNWQIAPVLKSNAYGHGLIPVAQIFDKEKPPFLAVDSYFEALSLHRAGIKSKILIIGYTDSKNILKSRLSKVVFTLTSLYQLKIISKELKKNQIFHLEIDTGMHRQGIAPDEVQESIKLIKNNPHIILEGIFSHLADADGEDCVPTLKQIGLWNWLVDIFRQEFPQLRFWHLSATAGYSFRDKILANVARVGLGLYGFAPRNLENVQLFPALEMYSVVSSVRKVEKGEKIGYNFTFFADRPMIIATIPIGYFEGVDRRLSNKGFVKINGVFCPIVGRVSMNMITVDLSFVPDLVIGQEAQIISVKSQDKNSVKNMAVLCEIIPYEILVHLPGHLRRTY